MKLTNPLKALRGICWVQRLVRRLSAWAWDEMFFDVGRVEWKYGRTAKEQAEEPLPRTTCSASFNSWLFVTIITTFQMGFLVDAVLWRIDRGELEHIGYPAAILVAVTISWALLIVRRPNAEHTDR